jgi:hypothetical protein
MARRFESFVPPPSFEVPEPRLLLPGLAPAAEFRRVSRA